MNKINKRIIDDLMWGRKHHTELLEKYENEWVAIYNKQIIASDKDPEKVEQIARSKGKEKFAIFYVDSGASVYAG
jgi:hypothetical protein